MTLPNVQVDTDYVKFTGGLDLVTPILSIKPGNALDAMNYEPGVQGGAKRIDGYERFSGRPAPSAAVYYYATVNLTGAVAVGNTVTGSTSGATGVVAQVSSTAIALTKVSGTFVAEAFTIGGTSRGSLTIAPIRNGCSSSYDDAVALNAAADIYRTDITTVNGARPIRGVIMYKGVVYAFQDNAGATACELFKSTSSGWAAVPLGRELSFTSGGTTEIVEGNTITGATSGATAVITRVARESGSWAGGDAAGRLIFASQTGAFQSENLNVGVSLNVATIAGNSSAITLLPGGRYEFRIDNFAGSTDTRRIYGCDGVNRAFEFDGTVFVPIRTGMNPDTPSHIEVFKKQLFLSFRGSSQNSGIGQPYVWTAVSGANEIGLGDTITGYQVQVGDVLAIFTRNSTSQLVGSSVSDFSLKPLSPETGAIAHTIQTVGYTYALDDRGVLQITPSQNYGNFNSDTVSQQAQAVIDRLRTVAIASAVYRSRNQYRIYGSDGTGVILTINGSKVVGISTLDYPIDITCAWSGEDSTGKDVVFFGASNGYVYQADKGSSFDGESIEAYLRLPFNNLRSPRYRKRYRKAVIEMSAVAYSAIRFQPEFSYGDSDIASHALQNAVATGSGSYWDVGLWDEFFYDAPIASVPEFSIEGTGTNMSLLFYSNTDIDLGHTLQGVIIHYTPRRLSR